MSLELIMFDCDGVILESVDAKTRAFKRAVECYGEAESEKLVQFHCQNGGVSRVIKFAWFFKEVLKREPTPEELTEVNEKFVDASLDEVLHAQEVPGVRDVLEYWKGRLPMYVASGAPHVELTMVLKNHGLAKFFDGIYGSPPGKTDLLRQILKETGVQPENSIMIGDTSTDQYAAEAVGAKFYGRGEFFKYSEYPWYYNLTKLNDYLKELDAGSV